MVSRTTAKGKTKGGVNKKAPARKVAENTRKQSMAVKSSLRSPRRIPPPPASDASAEELDAYFTKYSLDKLEKAGYARPLNAKEEAWTNQLTEAAKQRTRARAQLNLAFSDAELNRFFEYAQKKHIPPSTLAKAWIL